MARNKLVGILNWLVRKTGSYKTYGQTFEKKSKKKMYNTWKISQAGFEPTPIKFCSTLE